MLLEKMQSFLVKWPNERAARCFLHKKHSVTMIVTAFLNRTLPEQRPVDFLRQDWEQRKCREKKFMYFVPAIVLMNLKNCFIMQTTSCLTLHLSFSGLGKGQKKQERVLGFGSTRNALPRRDMRFMIPAHQEAVWVPRELSGMKHVKKIRSFQIYWMVFIFILFVNRIPMIWRQHLFL